ncbi:MAG TPA: hypothetical protein VK957_12600 [Lunatimonas sp.]|nr:hypothetical protein [Lunatimonas sp.]
MTRIEALAGRIVRLQGELDREIEKRRDTLGWRVNEGLVEFQAGITAKHKRLRLGVGAFLGRSSIATVATAPVIYSLIVPLIILDAWASLYQAICFRAYGIPRVERSRYLLYDRGRLRYLNWIEAFNCAFCEYANGVITLEISKRSTYFNLGEWVTQNQYGEFDGEAFYLKTFQG